MDQSPGGPSAYEVSRQLWAFLAPLLKENEGADMIFKNVVRHNGLEAWRRISEPVLEDSEFTRKDLQPSVLHPKGAGKLDERPVALERWETNLRKFRQAQGECPSDDQKRLILVDMLPSDMAPYITLQLGLYPSYEALQKYILQYCKVMGNMRRSHKPVHLLDHAREKGLHDDNGSEEEAEEEDEETAEILAFLEANHEPEAVMAFMKGKFKPGGKFARKPGAPQRGRAPAPKFGGRAAEPPPRSEADLSCINCGKKGHRAKDCRGAPKSREERPCFKCQKTGHIAGDCTAPLPVKAITASGGAFAPTSDNPRNYVFCIQNAPDADGFRLKGRPTENDRPLAEFLPRASTSTKVKNSWAALCEDILESLAGRPGTVRPKAQAVDTLPFPALPATLGVSKCAAAALRRQDGPGQPRDRSFCTDGACPGTGDVARAGTAIPGLQHAEVAGNIHTHNTYTDTNTDSHSYHLCNKCHTVCNNMCNSIDIFKDFSAQNEFLPAKEGIVEIVARQETSLVDQFLKCLISEDEFFAMMPCETNSIAPPPTSPTTTSAKASCGSAVDFGDFGGFDFYYYHHHRQKLHPLLYLSVVE